MRAVESVWKSKPTTEGAGVKLHRAFGQAEVPRLDPFLLLDDFSSPNPLDYLPGFPWHPHRGIETVTYMLSGRVKHEDSLGNKGIIDKGDLQWMNAGSGIVHQEMPQKSDDLTGFQLWINIPKMNKMMKPSYQDVSQEEVPEIDYNNARVKVIAGTVNGVTGPVKDVTVNPQYLDVRVPAGSTFIHKIPKGFKAFAFTIQGSGSFAQNHDAKERELVLYKDGNEVQITAEKDLRFLLISGKPLNQPIAWHGPIVMNTNEEIKKALKDLEEGTFTQDRPTQ